MSFRRFFALALIAMLSVCAAFAQSKSKPSDKFKQLEEDLLPTSNEQRTASGAPGRGYWQNRADYSIDVELDDTNQRIIGKETVVYKNLSPDSLTYIWLQLDQNIFAKDSLTQRTQTAPELKNVNLGNISNLVQREYDGKLNLTAVTDAKGAPLKYTVVDTMMRIDLPAPLAATTGTFTFQIAWNYNINNARIFGGRTGYEFFPADNNYIYEIAQWFPRMAAYHDTYGWQHKQFLGSGEFTLEFGDYTVRITAPDDHVVGATGVLQNAAQVLNNVQRQRLQQAATATEPIKIVTQDEAVASEKSKSAGKKTWIFKAANVRDFAFASSRKFIWDAQGHNVNANKVTAMSYYPKEGNPLWEKYSTQAIIHTLNVYSRYSFDYPYPIAISVNGPIGGMEYPMICFNGPRPDRDGTYPASTKYGLISVIIHEVGHNYFPMVVNSDERQWTWMDEGLNSFVQSLAEAEWEKNYPSRRGEPQNITDYMESENQVPIMTQSDSVLQFGANAYAKPATALTILRETVLGRENFDFAFKTYSQRWKFKRPQPADFFRTMEDASGVDLDWFWRGWFYSTDHVDISIDNVRLFQIDTRNPETEKGLRRQQRDAAPLTLSQQRNEGLPKRVDQIPSLKDFYNSYDPLAVTDADRAAYQQFLTGLTDSERQLISGNNYFYVVDLKNVGGLVMPLTFKVDYTDNTSELIRVPVEIWRYNNFNVSKLIAVKKEARSITLDPNLESADVDLSNNSFPRRPVPSRFQVFKALQGGGGARGEQPNPLRDNLKQPKQATDSGHTGAQQQPIAAAVVSNLTGRWNIAIEAPGNSVPLILVLTQQGEVVTGTIEGPGGSSPITAGTIASDGFTLRSSIPFGGQSIEITIAGKQTGNSLSGSVTAPQGTVPFSGTKAN